MISSRPNKKIVASAILAVYNAEKTVAKALSSLIAQSEPIEIIVVDDGSSDQTHTIITHTIQALPKSTQANIKVIKQKHLGPAHARNLGSKYAKTNILLFVDADMVFDRHYVKKLIAPIVAQKAIGTYTLEERVQNWHHRLARCLNYQENWATQKRFPNTHSFLGTDYRAILKSEFERVGGFDDIGYTDTWTLFKKLGIRPVATKAICYHKNPDTFKAVFRQAKWSAKRPYKFGLFGTFIALLRTSLPLSFLVGVMKSLKHKEPIFLPYKIIYDFGRFVGILEMLITKKLSK